MVAVAYHATIQTLRCAAGRSLTTVATGLLAGAGAVRGSDDAVGRLLAQTARCLRRL